ncbi:hypothetical protein CLUG_02794 [Clavispora lusitaniae ATCC 42720]|uniref:Uncharacterized protein n=1 Tax=Clavispora lusitaniae (strain ATCC 42720) TaxID=306902 RepID=C4Y2N1_CLAL4|nr:uncharacterized protein CLUG_02794 [Clavispora lusitaniae ATCC 42720]EEQ38668.1 hypothetical protein CLUG_02794 [Clavispora lusitaniae ATCC 42720]
MPNVSNLIHPSLLERKLNKRMSACDSYSGKKSDSISEMVCTKKSFLDSNSFFAREFKILAIPGLPLFVAMLPIRRHASSISKVIFFWSNACKNLGKLAIKDVSNLESPDPMISLSLSRFNLSRNLIVGSHAVADLKPTKTSSCKPSNFPSHLEGNVAIKHEIVSGASRSILETNLDIVEIVSINSCS